MAKFKKDLFLIIVGGINNTTFIRRKILFRVGWIQTHLYFHMLLTALFVGVRPHRATENGRRYLREENVTSGEGLQPQESQTKQTFDELYSSKCLFV